MVAPLAGAWIEIETSKIEVDGTVVAPLAGAWIEIIYEVLPQLLELCRSPCGSVD